MRKLFTSLSILAIAMTMVTGVAFAATITQTTSVTLASLISIEFASTADTTFGGGSIPWTSIDPSSSLVYPTGHVSTKPDTAVICRYNGTGKWALKMRFNSTSLEGKMKYYMDMPYYNGSQTNGTLGNPKPTAGSDWPIVPGDDFTVYTSGTVDSTNMPNGTFVGISYAINPEGLEGGATFHWGTITYTIVGGL